MKTLIAWFANNSVAANLTMVLIIVSGLMVMPLIERKITPEITFDIVEIRVALPGAGPSQVERSISRRIEQVIVGIEGILDVNTVAGKHLSTTTLEISDKVSLNEVINKVRARVDAVKLPKEAGRPIVREVMVIEPVLSLALSGDMSVESLSNIGESIAGDLRSLSGVSLVFLRNAPQRKFLVEVSDTSLARYQIDFSEIVRKLRAVSADITGATLKTGEGDVSVVGESSVNSVATLEDLAIRSFGDGARITLADLANIQDSYSADKAYRKFNGKNVVYIGINRAQDEDLIILANQVNRYVKHAQKSLPQGVDLIISGDVSKEVSGRIDMLTSNAIGGFVLVMVVLLLFMNLRLSFWTSLGIPISFLGAFFLLFFWGQSLNMVSLFAFILVLGIVVDDAIIVGESIYSQHEKNNFGVKGSVDGAFEVYRPVIFAVLTTMIAFAPMLFMPGEEGRLIFVVPMVVISVLAFSLIESLLILPSHLSGIRANKNELIPQLNKVQKQLSDSLNNFIKNIYKPNLEKALFWRYTVVVVFFVVFLISVSLLAFRWVNINIISKIESDTLVARIVMADDISLGEAEFAIKRLEEAAFTLQKEINENLGFSQVVHIASRLDSRNRSEGYVSLFLNPKEEREISSELLEERLLVLFGDVPHVRGMTIKASVVNTGNDIDLELTSTNLLDLKGASEDLRQLLLSYKGVRGAFNTFRQGKREIGFELKPEASDMGISSAQVAAQIRQTFHGESLTIINEVGDRVSVSVEYPEEQRNSLWFLENLPITLKDGSHTPLHSVADFYYRDAPTEINIHNGKRSIRVKARLDEKVSSAQIMASLRRDYLNQISDNYSGMNWKRAGGQKRGQEVLEYLFIAYPLSLLLMYLLMATLFASYSQPLMIMGAIPFGIVGALLGHLIMGVGITLWSLVGIIAVSGVVVNDNLVLVDRINRKRAEGMPLVEAIRDAGVARFRPIVLTSLTTFLGLAPLMLEDSVQAQFLIPMAVSLAYGVLFATVISLILVPVFYAI
jgi:multidrug efflux pump subunit AcrB